jgi:hypothetical protein
MPKQKTNKPTKQTGKLKATKPASKGDKAKLTSPLKFPGTTW